MIVSGVSVGEWDARGLGGQLSNPELPPAQHMIVVGEQSAFDGIPFPKSADCVENSSLMLRECIEQCCDEHIARETAHEVKMNVQQLPLRFVLSPWLDDAVGAHGWTSGRS